MSKTAIQWALVVFKLLAGVGGGILGFAGLAALLGRRTDDNRKALLVSLGLLLIAGCAVLIYVGKPSGIMLVVRNVSLNSPLSWELMSYGFAIVVSIVFLILGKSKGVLLKTLAIIAIIVAVAVGFTTGYSHLSMVGMRSWHNPLIPWCFLISALLLSGLIYLAITGKKEDEKDRKLITTIIVILAVFATLCYCAYGFTASLGDYAMLYWTAAPLIGGTISMVCAILMKIKDAAVWLYASATAALVGAVAFRAIIWLIVETGLRTGDSIVHI